MPRRHRLLSILAAAVAVVFVAAPPARAGETTVSEEWSVMRMAGADAGYTHTVVTRVEEPSGVLFRSDVASKFSINRLGAKITIEQSSSTIERENGEFVKTTSAMTFSSQKTVTETFFENGKARSVTHLMGTQRESTVDYPPDAKGPHFLTRLGKEKGFAPGTKYEMTTFANEVGGPTTASVSVIGKETVELLDGSKAELTRVDTVMDAMAVTTSVWVDAEGEPLKSSTPISGLVIETFRAEKERALAAAESKTELSPDVFAKTMIVSKEVVPYPRAATSALIRISPKKKGAKVPFTADNRQEVVRKDDDGSTVVRLKRLVPPAGKKAVRPIANPPAEIADCLSPNSMVQSDEAEIVKIATEVAGAVTDAWTAAQALERWVHTAMTSKSMDVGFASALEVCRTRAGDCSEHAVFLAALCRAAGIPARVVMGVEYIGGIWGGHAWNEVWIDGDWYALDGTLGYGFADPFHLAQSKMTMKDGGFGKEFAGLLESLGQIDIEVLEVEYGGRTLSPAKDAAATENGRYVNRLWGFSFAVPEKFGVHPRKPAAAIDFSLLEMEGPASDGKECEIEIDVHDTPSVVDWSEIVSGMKKRGPTEVTETTVDGRPARLLDVARNGRTSRVAMVVAGDAMYVFTLDRAAADADKALFETFLKSVDFDVASRNN